jgi:hypothetical protein
MLVVETLNETRVETVESQSAKNLQNSNTDACDEAKDSVDKQKDGSLLLQATFREEALMG